MAMEQSQGNSSTILMVIIVGLVGFGLGWLVGNNNVTPESGDEAAAVAEADVADGEGYGDSERLPVGDSPIMGNPNAPVTVVEFTSMQCPFCARGGETLKELVEKYPEDVRVVFKHFPLAMQTHAKPASIAVEAAHRQGKAFEMKDGLFEQMRQYNDEMEDMAAAIAEDLGMDVEQFRADFNDPEVEARVDADLQLGQGLGVRGTPHFFVNGEVVNGAQPLEKFSEVVDRQLGIIENLREEGTAQNELYAAAVEQNMGGAAAPSAQREQPQRPQQPEKEVHMLEIQDYDFVKGASADEALVTIMEFSSFQCPHCARGASTLSQLLEKYPDQVRVVFKHFPLGFQQHSEPASRASVAAGNQDKFWEYYDLLYQNQRQLGEDGIFERLAEELGLNMNTFRADFEDEATAKIVRDSQAEGRSVGIRGTPGFLINGIKETGAQPLRVFENHVKEQIEIAEKIRDDEGLSGEELYAAIVEHNKENAGGGGDAPSPTARPQADTIDPDALSVGDSFYKGPSDAAVTIYEFSSFQCPFCARAADTMKEVIEEFDGDVRLVYKNFPLGFQQHSEPAARAAVAAGQQDRFWEMYEALYANQRRFGQDGLWEELARDIGLDMNRFRSDFESDAVRNQVRAEQREGSSVGVQGTPAFFINGEKLTGAQPIQRFREVINKHLDG